MSILKWLFGTKSAQSDHGPAGEPAPEQESVPAPAPPAGHEIRLIGAYRMAPTRKQMGDASIFLGMTTW